MNRRIGILFVIAGLMLIATGPAHAWYVRGVVLCDANIDGQFDGGDTPIEHAIVTVTNEAGTFSDTTMTDSDGAYFIRLPDLPDTYILTIDEMTVPADATYVHPPTGEYVFALDFGNEHAFRDWLLNSATCQQQQCWMTGGGVKFDNVSRSHLAEKGPRHNMGGNVYPSCSPDPGDGGQWTHIAHTEKLRFQGRDITVVRCGNVPGTEPGSESPVTPYNFIEYEGVGPLKGIKGNKDDFGDVHFFARVEDRNEPGNESSSDGEDIDRYFLHVFSDPANPTGTTLLLVDGDGDPSTVDPVTITGGNLQLHISSCDDPPN